MINLLEVVIRNCLTVFTGKREEIDKNLNVRDYIAKTTRKLGPGLIYLDYLTLIDVINPHK
jgi:hypothetical protein